MTQQGDEFTLYVVTRLGRSANRDDLIMEVCQEKDLDWDDAEAWVDQVAAEHSRAISRRLAPAFIALCGAAIVGGLALAVSAFHTMILPVLAYRRGANEIGSLTMYTVLLGYYLPQFIGGASLTAGGAVGLVRLWNKIRYNEPLDA